MRIRLSGTRAECEHTAAQLAAALDVLETSAFYPNRGSSQIGRVYLETRTGSADPEGETRS